MVAWVINCHWIDDLDASGLGSLVQIFKEVRDSGRSIALTGNKRVGQTVKLVRLEEFFCWDNNMESAIYNVTFSQSIENKLDSFFGEIGADICEVALYLGRMEGKLKARVMEVLIPVLAELSAVEAITIKNSSICKQVLKSVGFESKNYWKAIRRLLAKKNPEVRVALESLLEELSVDDKGKPDKAIAAMAAKTYEKFDHFIQ